MSVVSMFRLCWYFLIVLGVVFSAVFFGASFLLVLVSGLILAFFVVLVELAAGGGVSPPVFRPRQATTKAEPSFSVRKGEGVLKSGRGVLKSAGGERLKGWVLPVVVGFLVFLFFLSFGSFLLKAVEFYTPRTIVLAGSSEGAGSGTALLPPLFPPRSAGGLNFSSSVVSRGESEDSSGGLSGGLGEEGVRRVVFEVLKERGPVDEELVKRVVRERLKVLLGVAKRCVVVSWVGNASEQVHMTCPLSSEEREKLLLSLKD